MDRKVPLLLWFVGTVGAPAYSIADPVLPSPASIQELVRNPPTGAPAIELRTRVRDDVPGTQRTDTYVGSIDLSPPLLSKPTDATLDGAKRQVAFEDPPQIAVVALDIQASRYELFSVDETADGERGPIDPYRGLVHVTMAVLNEPGSYMRATIDPTGDLLYATLYARGATYRIVPRPEQSIQDVYRVERGNQSAKFSSNPKVERLAERQRQLEVIAKLKPEFVTVSPGSRSLAIIGGELGSMARHDERSFQQLIKRLSPLVESDGAEAFKLMESVAGGNHQILKFSQIYSGIPVRGYNTVTVSSAGKVTEVNLQLGASDLKLPDPQLTAEDARAKAVLQWEKTFGQRPSVFEIEGPNLWYDVFNGAYAPIYEMRLRIVGRDHVYRVRVNAVSGEAEVLELSSSGALSTDNGSGQLSVGRRQSHVDVHEPFIDQLKVRSPNAETTHLPRTTYMFVPPAYVPRYRRSSDRSLALNSSHRGRAAPNGTI